MSQNFYILGQVFTLLSYIVFWVSRYFKKKNNILILDSVSRIIAIISFIFLGKFDGVKNTIYAIFRNIIGQITNKKNKKIKITAFILMLLILIGVYTFKFDGIATICIGICGVVNLYGTIMCNEQGLRISGMLGSGFYTLFMLFTLNYTGIICEIICFGVMLTSYIKYKEKRELKKDGK